jgi:hypothetical protein
MERVVLARVDGILIRSYPPSLFLFLFLSSSRNNLFVLFRRTLCCCVLLFFSCPVFLKKYHFFLYLQSSLWPRVPHTHSVCYPFTTICLSRICWVSPLSGFSCCPSTILLLIYLLNWLAEFARYSCWTHPVTSEWISALLSQDSLTDSLAGFAGFSR